MAQSSHSLLRAQIDFAADVLVRVGLKIDAGAHYYSAAHAALLEAAQERKLTMDAQTQPSFNAIDCMSGSDAIDHAGELKDAGVQAVGLYYFQESEIKHLLTADLARSLTDKGLAVFSIYENGEPNHSGYFSEAAGAEDAKWALHRALQASQPRGKIIVLTVDYDAQEADLPAITDYFGAARAVCHPVYPLAVYANGLVCRRLTELGLVSRTMLSCSRDFAGHADWLPKADIVQVKCSLMVGGVSCDTDLFKGNPLDYGAWTLAS